MKIQTIFFNNTKDSGGNVFPLLQVLPFGDASYGLPDGGDSILVGYSSQVSYTSTRYTTSPQPLDEPTDCRLTLRVDDNPESLYFMGYFINPETGIAYLNSSKCPEMIQFFNIKDFWYSILYDAFTTVFDYNAFEEVKSKIKLDLKTMIGDIQKYKLNGDFTEFSETFFKSAPSYSRKDSSVIGKILTKSSYQDTFTLYDYTKEDQINLLNEVSLLLIQKIRYFDALRDAISGMLCHLNSETYPENITSPTHGLVNTEPLPSLVRRFQSDLAWRSELTGFYDPFMEMVVMEWGGWDIFDDHSKELNHLLYAMSTENTIKHGEEIIQVQDRKGDKIVVPQFIPWEEIQRNNFLDILEGMADENEIIYSSEPQMMFKRYGFNKILGKKDLLQLGTALRQAKLKKNSDLLFKYPDIKSLVKNKDFGDGTRTFTMFNYYNKIMNYIGGVQ